jgi:hypothetical protein
MDQLHDLVLRVAQDILAAETEAERYELGVEEKDWPAGQDLVELAARVLMEELGIARYRAYRSAISPRTRLLRSTGAARPGD